MTLKQLSKIKRAKVLFEGIFAENFPNLRQYMNLQIKVVQQP
jgi:hypothetical protein